LYWQTLTPPADVQVGQELQFLEGVPFAKEVLAALVSVANMEYGETEENPCEVPACPLTFTLQTNFFLKLVALPMLMGLIVLVYMLIWNWGSKNSRLVAWGRKVSCDKLCKVRQRKEKQMPLSLLCAAHVPMVQLLLDGTTRLKEHTEASELKDATFQEMLAFEEYLTTSGPHAAVLTPAERASISWRAAVAGMGATHRQEPLVSEHSDRKQELLDLVQKHEEKADTENTLWIWSIHSRRALCEVFMFCSGLER
jgi:hypothetical protein